ncbi:solute carrier family 22 member 14 isoform X5 [Pongo pygmaeus]|uniref:Solute carrier family 22 member 14 n=2 Tax=Pongo TaxID=9599 RepID=H2PB56_PONAB|nr:solute carrier family 22 member 14 isoform X5 [Pongo pygmaeus]XP_054336366.1 solute carrier family 22 member 14 isoform X5 [Pongo pygmaeus]XP_054336367.1 solute carrier family 22 member 14 isoform X5 [Pongo pygmaeus]XP_054336368.1 solute carrier family 22 member 14 isoform X5 [Pongo pygmaeus]XP_054408263.1 solute carrier family 22 member 14 isoform X1 [Pongo abelii]XP_054408270.1 solute carrier family 22 member 14 isoform X1 [Pongo abelii]XP_054408271.1 solute carrier family 22 member 14 i
MAGEENFKEELRSQDASRNLNQHEAAGHPHSWSLEMLLRRLRAVHTKQNDKFANLLDAVGEFGTFQQRLVALTFIPSIMSAFFMFADHFVFTAQKPYCNTSWILAVGPHLSEAEQLNLTIPQAPNGSFLTCLMYLPVPWNLDSIIQFGLNDTDTCQDGWIYPDAKKRSLTNEFDLVCGMETKKDTAQIMFMAGLLIGSLIFGLITDKMGRYPAILLSLLGLIIFGFGTAFVNSFHLYLFFRFGISQSVVGYAISSISLATEWLVGEHRAHAIILEHCFFAVGAMLLTGIAYSLPHWRLLFLVGGILAIPLISYIWILPESPRWLMMKGKVKEAKQVLCYAASVNKKTIPSNLLDELQLPRKKVTRASVLDFCKNRQLCKVTLVMSCVWFTVSYTYFTLSLRMRELGVSVHFRHVVPSIMEVPARLCCIFLLQQIGRKWSLAVTLLQAIIWCLLLLFLPEELKSMTILVLTLGKFSLAATVTVFFLYTAELLPTVLRATGVGLVSLASAAGAILSLTIISQTPSLLPIFLCCVLAIVAFSLSLLLPETRDQPLSESLGHSSQMRNKVKDMKTEETSSDDMSEEAAKNVILNAQILRLDPYPVSNPALKQFNKEEANSQAP